MDNTHRRFWLIELPTLTVLILLIVVVATWIARPSLDRAADSSDFRVSLGGFWAREHSEGTTYRWSQPDAALRLFGFEQRAPLLLRARLSASRKPDEPLAQLTINSGAESFQFPINREWRRYRLLIPAPPRGPEGRTIAFHTVVDPPYSDRRALGVALSQVAVAELPLRSSDRFPDAERVLFLLLLGLLAYTALRRILPTRIAAPLILIAVVALGCALALAPAVVAYWLPNLWLALLIGWLALLLPPALRRIGELAPIWVFAVLLAVGAAQILLPIQQPWSSVLGWTLLIGGCTLFVAIPPRQLPADARPIDGKVLGLALGSITLLALAVRLVALDQLPLGLWRDEARHGLLALRILHDPSYRPIYVPDVADIPALLFYLDALPIAIFGNQVWAVRAIPAIAGGLTPLALYFAARPLFGPRIGLLAAGLLSISVWHITLSRLGFAATLGPPLTLLAIGFIWRALQPQARRPLLLAALAGGATGLALYAYHPSRLTPLVVAFASLLLLGRQAKTWRAALPRLAIAFLAAVIVAAPLISYVLGDAAGFSRRIGQTSIFGEDSLEMRAPAARIEENLRLNLGIWNERGDRIGRHNLPYAPLLDPLTGAIFALGVGLSLAVWRDRRALFLLGWLALGLIPGLFSIEAPHAVRTVETIAPSMLLASLGAAALLQRVWVAVHPLQRRLVSVVGLALLLAVLALNLSRYFVAWPADPLVASEFYVAETQLGSFLQRLAADPQFKADNYRVLVPSATAERDVTQYLTAGLEIGRSDGVKSLKPDEHVLLIVDGSCNLMAPAVVDATPLGLGPRSPINNCPEFAVYGQGPQARQIVERALAP